MAASRSSSHRSVNSESDVEPYGAKNRAKGPQAEKHYVEYERPDVGVKPLERHPHVKDPQHLLFLGMNMACGVVTALLVVYGGYHAEHPMAVVIVNACPLVRNHFAEGLVLRMARKASLSFLVDFGSDFSGADWRT